MQALFFKQRRQFWNALRQTFSSPRQLLALLIVVLYGSANLCIVLALVIYEPPDELRRLIGDALGFGDPADRLATLRAGLVLTLLLLISTAAFQNPLLQFAQADIDLLFAAPIPSYRMMLGRLINNHIRTFVAGFFFWGLATAPALRLLGYVPWEGAWLTLLGLMALFASVDQAAALVQLGLQRTMMQASVEDDDKRRWPIRLVLLGFGLFGLFGLLALLERLALGSWGLLSTVLALVNGPLSRTLLLPLGLAGDLLLAPATPGSNGALALFGLLLLDLVTAGGLLFYLARGGADAFREAVITPQTSAMGELIASVGPNPARIVGVLWSGEIAQSGTATATGRYEGETFAPNTSPFQVQLQRRWREIRRTPLRSGLAVAVLGLLPLALYQPHDGYSLGRLLTAIIFSTSLGSQLFNDAADHLRYGNLELALPVPRWRLLLGAMLPRLALYWLGGGVLIVGAGFLAAEANWVELIVLLLWYPLVVLPLLSLRASLLFLYPAAGIPGQKDPVQLVLVALINSVLVMIVLALSLLPFGLIAALIQIFALNNMLLWPFVLLTSGILSVACFALMNWLYGRFEPGESL
jgi:hypothetical protein